MVLPDSAMEKVILTVGGGEVVLGARAPSGSPVWPATVWRQLDQLFCPRAGKLAGSTGLSHRTRVPDQEIR